MPKFLKAIIERVKGKKGLIIELHIKNKNGEKRFLKVSSFFIKKDGKILGVMAIARDVTKEMEIEQRLKESEEKFRTI